ncbi:extensin [Streptomyces endophytica]|uniref:Extensin n=1 Tax=Streptomyces endophytica TaxID=2991496 RepID=A0ABY6PHU9_9ACTN|nr:extensin [Streptomyces endophytica]UZJ33459.1 extensin [Streptomyces endophytica]
MVKQIQACEAVELLRNMTRVLCVVGILALVFTTVNVTRFAISRHVPLPIAVLLDPMLGIALAGVLYVDARLASWGIRPPAWSTTLRWSAGSTAALMNTWESLWPDGQIGWPNQADPAAVLLHLTPALLLIALTETIAAYRRTVTDLLNQIGISRSTDPTDPHTALASRSASAASNQLHTASLTTNPSDQAPIGIHVPDVPDVQPDAPNSAPPGRSSLPSPPAPPTGAANPDVWPHAIAVDEAARVATGKPASIWRLRTDLHIGPKRARQIHHDLQARSPDPSHPIG